MINLVKALQQRLDQGLFLSALHEYTFGAYCASRSAGCAMVQTGLYFSEPEADEATLSRYPDTFLPEDPGKCLDFLAKDCRQARLGNEAVVSMNLGALSLEPALRAARIFLEAGGDAVELNIHGGFIRYIKAGRMRAMLFPQNQAELYRWIQAFVDHSIPLIVKFSPTDHRAELIKVLQEIGELPLVGVHVNIRSEATKRPDFELLEQVRGTYSGFLLVSGWIRTAADVRSCFSAGANMAGFGEPVMEEPGFISRIRSDLPI
jgi:tRNA-dihydrouridine synthase